jgi:hypothetical protein
MSKHHRVAAFVESLASAAHPSLHPCYAGYFECFNAREYYEAHDVLEHLWLDCTDSNRPFYQGLIQIAGAYVHLKKQHARPHHPVDGRRLPPADRLFALGMANIAPFRPVHLSLDVDAVLSLCAEWRQRLAASSFRENPWSPANAPTIHPTP